tara:strand:- start:635 stop:856 length:222 start_codon:yes stop_codon:yes gene_type:complete
MNESKHERFKRIASKRMQNTLKEMSRLTNCSNTNTYEYTNRDVQKMIKTLNEKIQELRVAFKKGVRHDNKFKF